MEEQDALFVAPLATSEQLQQAERQGWPADLLERMLALRWPAWKVELYLSADGFPTVEMVESEVRDRERLSTGLSAREATWEDDERLTDLFANSTERLGDWNVVVERSPNPFAQHACKRTGMSRCSTIVASLSPPTCRPGEVHMSMAGRSR